MAQAGRGGRDEVHKPVVVNFTGRIAFARLPHDCARAGQTPLKVPIEHGAARKHYRGQVEGAGGHDARRRGFVAPRGEHHAINGIAVQDFDQAQVREVAVERGRGPFALLGDGMNRKFKGDAPVVPNPGFDPVCQFDVDAVTRREVPAGLRDADDGFARLEFFARPAVVHVAFHIHRGHAHVVRVVEPLLTPQVPFDFGIIPLHGCSFGLSHSRCSDARDASSAQILNPENFGGVMFATIFMVRGHLVIFGGCAPTLWRIRLKFIKVVRFIFKALTVARPVCVRPTMYIKSARHWKCRFHCWRRG